jgi:hypothetical protein
MVNWIENPNHYPLPFTNDAPQYRADTLKMPLVSFKIAIAIDFTAMKNP